MTSNKNSVSDTLFQKYEQLKQQNFDTVMFEYPKLYSLRPERKIKENSRNNIVISNKSTAKKVINKFKSSNH